MTYVDGRPPSTEGDWHRPSDRGTAALHRHDASRAHRRWYPSPSDSISPVPAPASAIELAERHLQRADRALPGRIRGFYLVGSTALGAFRPGRSDVDFLAVVDRDLTDEELRRLRTVARRSSLRSARDALVHGHVALPGTVNGAYVREEDLGKPVSTIRPVASHVALSFRRGAAFDVNPVLWKELADGGVPLRGAAPAALGLDPEPDRLRACNLENLDSYWQSWAQRAVAGRLVRLPHTTGWIVSWGVLGAPRLHHTIHTGGVISKEAAGEYALSVFAPKWHQTISDALAFQRLEKRSHTRSRRERIATAGEFVCEVIESAHRTSTP